MFQSCDFSTSLLPFTFFFWNFSLGKIQSFCVYLWTQSLTKISMSLWGLPWWLGGEENHLLTQETWVRSLGREDPLEKEVATRSRIIAWRILWTEEPGRLPPMGSQRVGHGWATEHMYEWPHVASLFICYNKHSFYIYISESVEQHRVCSSLPSLLTCEFSFCLCETWLH